MPGMLFGLNLSTEAQAGTDPAASVSKAEQLGFDFVSASDHLHGGRPTYELWTLLSWIAAATSQGDLRAALPRCERRQLAVGRAMLERTRRNGNKSQFEGTWRSGDPELVFGLYEPGR